ncbi:MAG: hypothetical protein OHK93_006913 [Ramalina farinacea]|uniref:Uncharacterized protein n=1 Tax=Ramalina farinacea TaxID=258253 RepID=A0AA43QMW9_9LECA|nr:hypothetical protein [Ramalina farinacea]
MVVTAPVNRIPNIPVYYTIPSTDLLNNTFTHDYEIGSFARFEHPQTIFTLHDDPSLHGLSHVDIRVALDSRGVTDPVILIDNNVLPPQHAVWWCLDTETSQYYSGTYKDYTITYPDEPFTLWQLLLLTQHADLEYRIGGGRFTELLELAHQYPPYDPHSPQQPPFSLGKDFANKSEAAGFLGKTSVTASFEEIEWTDDQHVIAPRFKRLTPHPPPILYIVKLKQDIAAEAGLGFDWDSPRWDDVPVPGSAGDVGLGSAVGNETALKLAQETLLCGSTVSKGDDGMVQDVQDEEGLDFAQRCGSAAGNASGSVIQLAAGPASVAGSSADVTS